MLSNLANCLMKWGEVGSSGKDFLWWHCGIGLAETGRQSLWSIFIAFYKSHSIINTFFLWFGALVCISSFSIFSFAHIKRFYTKVMEKEMATYSSNLA